MTINPQAIDWLSLQVSPWEESVFSDLLPLHVKRYYVKRHDGLPISIRLTALPEDAGIVRADLEICATRALRSYEGCPCSYDAPCKAHAKAVDVRTFRGLPDEQANNPARLRAYLEGRNA